MEENEHLQSITSYTEENIRSLVRPFAVVVGLQR